MTRALVLASLLLISLLARSATSSAADVAGLAQCLFDTENALCRTQDWNDDGFVSAPDLHGRLRFTPVGVDEVRIGENPRAVILRSDTVTTRIDKGSAEIVLGDAAGTGLTVVQAPILKLGSASQPFGPVLEVRGLPRGVEIEAGTGDSPATWTIELITSRSLRTRLRPSDPASVTRVVTSVVATEGERFYGLTERIADNRGASEIVPLAVGGLDRRGQAFTMLVTPTLSLYAPLLHSSRGYGVYVEGTMTGLYDVAKTIPDVVTIDFEFNQRIGEHAVVYFVGDHDAILDEYTRLTGRPFLPPPWAFRHLRWRDEHRLDDPVALDGVAMNADLVDDVMMYESLGIPTGNYAFDRPWADGFTNRGQEGFSSFRFDPIRFPNSADMLEALGRRGYRALIWGAPWALGENAEDAEQLGYYAPRSDILIDYTNPEASAWWAARVQTLIDQGIVGMKLDRSEFDVSELPVVPNRDTDVFADGRNGRELMNGYTIEFARVHHDAFAERLGGEFFHYLRAGYAGSQRYGIFWGGDTTGRNAFGISTPTDLGLRSAIQSLAHVAFIGFSIWGTDTCGYYQFGQRDVFARWLQLSAFCPFMEIGGGNQGGGQHAPWDMPTDPNFDSEMIDIYRFYVTLHHELAPLFYSLAVEANASGRPLVRPLVFDHPDNPAVGDLWDEFLLGDLLFAPLWRDGDRARQVYLPAGTWIDYWEPSRRFVGPTTVDADAPLDRIPLYVRSGGILPLDVRSSVTGNGSTASAGRLTLDVYPSGESSFVLREEGGESTFAVGQEPCVESSCVTIQFGGRPRSYVVRLLLDAAGEVLLDGNPLHRAESFAAFELVESGWYLDTNGGRLWVKFDAGPEARLSVTPASVLSQFDEEPRETVIARSVATKQSRRS
jgi:alpha-D-xyloside xylohydrolase